MPLEVHINNARIAEKAVKKRSARYGKTLAASMMAAVAEDRLCQETLKCADAAYFAPDFESRYKEMAAATEDGTDDGDGDDGGCGGGSGRGGGAGETTAADGEEGARPAAAARAGGAAHADVDDGEEGAGADSADDDVGECRAMRVGGHADPPRQSLIDEAIAADRDEDGEPSTVTDAADAESEKEGDGFLACAELSEEDFSARAIAHEAQPPGGGACAVFATRALIAATRGAAAAAGTDVAAMSAFALDLAKADWPSSSGGKKLARKYGEDIPVGEYERSFARFVRSYFSPGSTHTPFFSHSVVLLYLARKFGMPLSVHPFRSASRGAHGSLLATIGGAEHALLVGGMGSAIKQSGRWELHDCDRTSRVVLGEDEGGGSEWRRLAATTSEVYILAS